jgi:hypothetical protein
MVYVTPFNLNLIFPPVCEYVITPVPGSVVDFSLPMVTSPRILILPSNAAFAETDPSG